MRSDQPLREDIVQHLQAARLVRCGPEQVGDLVLTDDGLQRVAEAK
jgi:hypothetical protein